jgi:predicted amidohydrolase
MSPGMKLPSGAAAADGVSVVVFPELSLIGYEPDIAASLAFTDGHQRRINPRRRHCPHQSMLLCPYS